MQNTDDIRVVIVVRINPLQPEKYLLTIKGKGKDIKVTNDTGKMTSRIYRLTDKPISGLRYNILIKKDMRFIIIRTIKTLSGGNPNLRIM